MKFLRMALALLLLTAGYSVFAADKLISSQKPKIPETADNTAPSIPYFP